jgi:hypothetical protein
MKSPVSYPDRAGTARPTPTRRASEGIGSASSAGRGVRGALVLALAGSITFVRPPAIAGQASPTRLEAESADSSGAEFFEKSVRPILAARCQGCHGPTKQKGNLRLDSRESVLAGGSTGPAVVAGKPEASLLVQAINYGEDRQMPPKSKLADTEITALTHWVQIGAPWGVQPRPEASARDARAGASTSGDFQSQIKQRARHWSFQPIQRRPPPDVLPALGRWVRNPIDRFIAATLTEHRLVPAPEAPRRTLIRRLTFDLAGLSPTPEEVDAFLADPCPGAYERLVDRLLASPHYGERWARHWLDLVRYAETAGHEFDYDILNAYRYRDYVIRAFNSGLAYDRFVVEHLAGDLLPEPRRHPSLGFNESILGTGFYFLGEGTHSPVDVREDEVRRIDNQIDVLSKTFLGLTVACARCHDHKFDPISSKDYYALAGYLRSSRYQQAFIDPPGRIGECTRRRADAAHEIVTLLRGCRGLLPEPLRDRISTVIDPPLAMATGFTREATARPGAQGRLALAVQHAVDESSTETVFEDFERASFEGWTVSGAAFGDRPSRTGDVRLDFSGGSIRLVRIPPGQAHSGLISDRLSGVLRSPTFTIDSRYIHYRVAGSGGTINVVVDGYEKIRDPIYGGLSLQVEAGDAPRWVSQDVGMWRGQTAYIELADGAVSDYRGATAVLREGRGYLAVDEIRMSNDGRPSDSRPDDVRVSIELDEIVAALQRGKSPLAGRLEAALGHVRAAESDIPVPALALAIADGTGLDEHILIRGDHKNPGELVHRRFLEVLGGGAASNQACGSGRLELARRLVDPATNPLPARVLVNRLWKHHFGEGIVRSTDDFGAMGREPALPALLDWMAAELIERAWSMKAVVRLIVTSSTYRMASTPSADAERIDPGNVYLHRMNARRLEAETLRDAILAASGDLVKTMYGPGVPVHLTPFMEGRGRPARSGPLDGDGRRSIYLAVRRNFLNPMFLAFDAPVPFSTMGRRNVSNVPAQALVLLNDPLIQRAAKRWAARELGASGRSDQDHLSKLFATAFARLPTEEELRNCRAYLRDRSADDQALSAWTDLCHILFNTKEFIFVD